MSKHEQQMRKMAELALDQAEGGAQLNVTDQVLREALLMAITKQLLRAYQLAACA